MHEIYKNEIGKSRLTSPDHESQSELRNVWFNAFEKKLRQKFPEPLEDAKIQIVGSVAKGLASKDSDIDIIIRHKSSNEFIIPKIRMSILQLLKEMREKGEPTYKIDIQEVGNPLMFSNLANYKRSQEK